MANKLDPKIAGQTPSSLHLQRNGVSLQADRVELERLLVDSGQVWIADAAWVDEVPALPVKFGRGEFPVYAYRWQHRLGPINVCAVVVLSQRAPATSQQLGINSDIRPDLTKGIIVDTAEVGLRSTNTVTISSGLGDGYYPVFANYDDKQQIQSLVVDFEVWKVDRRLTDRSVDEYGLPEQVEIGPEDPAEAARVRAEYRQRRLTRVAAEIASGSRFSSGPPCPSCDKPLRTARARQCFLCGYRPASPNDP